MPRDRTHVITACKFLNAVAVAWNNDDANNQHSSFRLMQRINRLSLQKQYWT